MVTRPNAYGSGAKPNKDMPHTPEDRELRQMERCHSESIIYERKAGKPKSKLDSRIYPAWWGEPSIDAGRAAKKQAPPSNF